MDSIWKLLVLFLCDFWRFYRAKFGTVRRDLFLQLVCTISFGLVFASYYGSRVRDRVIVEENGCCNWKDAATGSFMIPNISFGSEKEVSLQIVLVYPTAINIASHARLNASKTPLVPRLVLNGDAETISAKLIYITVQQLFCFFACV